MQSRYEIYSKVKGLESLERELLMSNSRHKKGQESKVINPKSNSQNLKVLVRQKECIPILSKRLTTKVAAIRTKSACADLNSACIGRLGLYSPRLPACGRIFAKTECSRQKSKIPSTVLLTFEVLLLTLFAVPMRATAQSTNPLAVVVNSNQDGNVQPDNALTLREAIALVNGQLSLDRLSEAEKAQVRPLDSNTSSRIEFNLPPDQTTIQLQGLLPALASPGLVVDGTTQPGYDATQSRTTEIEIPTPVVAIAPAPDREVLRGLTIVADNITVRGLSIYGFGKFGGATLNTPPGDIVIDRRPAYPDVTTQPPFSSVDLNSPRPNSKASEAKPPQNVAIELNWLGIPPSEQVPSQLSAFGVYVFNSLGTTIRRNRITNHEGSGIITSVRAENLLVTENILIGNGLTGMPDAIRLEGNIDNSQITGNLICGNDGSGVYLFKPNGSVQISNNQITYNGRRLRRAAVYLMGNNHRVIDNQISYQAGPGVVVTAYPQNDVQRNRSASRNVIENNRFAQLEGLSIDLNTQQNVEPVHFQRGDGPNPPRNSPNRREETGNSAINAPQFLSPEFFVLGREVKLFGKADPGSTVEIYRVSESTTSSYGPLSEPLTNVNTNETGEFSATLTNLQPGDRVSAIATHPQYGTSEPALNAKVVAPDGTGTAQPASPPPTIPQCLAQAPPTPAEPASPEPTPQPEPLRLRVPRNIHFALDQSTITPESAAILDQIVAVLRSYDFLTVEIQGHTDPRASNAYNQALGMRRAIAARNYLIRQGIAPERLTIRSFGETQRRTSGTDVVDYARDRRVEFIFQDTRGLEIIFETQETDLQVEPTGGSR
jgi:outer membrane protein OmpA-like peptidoglycan-associated protein